MRFVATCVCSCPPAPPAQLLDTHIMPPPPDEPVRVKVLNVPHDCKVSRVEDTVQGVAGFLSWQSDRAAGEHVHVDGSVGVNYFCNMKRSAVPTLKKTAGRLDKKGATKKIDVRVVGKGGVQKRRKQHQRLSSKCVNLQVIVEKSSQHFADERFKPLVEEWLRMRAQAWSIRHWDRWVPQNAGRPEKSFECHLLVLEFDSPEIATGFVGQRKIDSVEVAPGVRCIAVQKHPNPRIYGPKKKAVQIAKARPTTTNRHTDGPPPRSEDPSHGDAAYFDCPAGLEDPRPTREVARARHARQSYGPPSEPESSVGTYPQSSSVQDVGERTRFVTESRLRPRGLPPCG